MRNFETSLAGVRFAVKDKKELADKEMETVKQVFDGIAGLKDVTGDPPFIDGNSDIQTNMQTGKSMTDAVDDFWIPNIGKYKEKEFKSITKGTVDLSKFESSKGKINKSNKNTI